ncbi:hypothetical protein [Larkinella soli]|uniref:hypothetical protein n=1 Tax=Larkinella soli TaxID=1770527 RepID=UPI000FFC969F|nr:hypothetical protein [Larkinella soli]
MKKTIITLLALAAFTTTGAFAQRTYNPEAGRRNPAPYSTPADTRYDDYREDLRIDRLDDVVKLSRKQERDLKRIEDRYDARELAATQRRSPQAYRRILARKQREMMDVLTPAQRQKWMAFQESGRFGRGNGFGRRS